MNASIQCGLALQYVIYSHCTVHRLSLTRSNFHCEFAKRLCVSNTVSPFAKHCLISCFWCYNFTFGLNWNFWQEISLLNLAYFIYSFMIIRFIYFTKILFLAKKTYCKFSNFFVTSLTLCIVQGKYCICMLTSCCDSAKIYLQNKPNNIKKCWLLRTLFKI